MESKHHLNLLWSGLIALLFCSPAIAALPEMPEGWSDGYVYANGIRLHYYRAVPAPGKPVMVMVHGVTDNGLCWTTLTRELQDAYDIYMLDTRGHGLSDPFTAADDGETLVKDVVAFVQAMNFEKPILTGHSMGAATVMRLGAAYPELPKAVIMLDPMLRPFPAESRSSAPKTREQESSKPKQPKPQAADRLAVNMQGTPEMLVMQNNYRFEDLVATCHRNSPQWDSLDCQYWALSKKQYHGAYTEEAWQAMSGTMRTGDALAGIVVPALVLKADAPADVRQANEEAARSMQKGRLVHIDGAGHNLHHDKRAQTVAAMREFLKTLR